MSPTLYRAALWFADELGLDVVVAMIDGHRVERLPADGALFAAPAVHGRDFQYVFGLEGLANDRPMRVFIPTVPERHLAVRRAALDRFDGHASVVWSDQTGIEILAAGTNKGEAVTWLAASLGIGMDEVAAVGDAPNDSEMLSLAGHSAAMRSAPPEVQACADVVVPPASELGILHAFAWFFPDLASEFTLEGDAPRSIAV